MRKGIGFSIACAAAMAAAQWLGTADAAAPIVRVKAKLTAFDGQVLTLEPLPEKGVTRPAGPQTAAPKGGMPQPARTAAPQPGVPQAQPATFTVSVLPDTRYVGSDKAVLDGVKPGMYAGAAVTQSPDGSLKAADVYLYAEALRGSGEGRFFEADRLIINGVVSAVQPPPAGGAGSMTLHYRGAALSGLGRGKTLCEGRASPPAYASALACQADAVIAVTASTPVSALTPGDKSLLLPGSLVTVAMTKTPDNKDVTPGVIVEKSVANPATPP